MDLNDVDFESLDYEQPLDQSGESGTEGIIDSVNAQVAERGVVDAPSYTTEPPQNTEDNDKKDVLTEFLKFSGIKDPEHIKFEDEDGIIKEQSWNDLSFEEKMNILTTSYQQPERDLDEDEIELVNELRRKNMTPEQREQFKELIEVEVEIAITPIPVNMINADIITVDEMLDLQYLFKMD